MNNNLINKDKLSMLVCILLASLFLIFPIQSVSIVSRITQYAIHQFGLGFIIFSSIMVLLCILIVLSPYGKIRLGGEQQQPEFTTWSWIAMLFAAGMGSGLIFWGVAEPLYHLSNPPTFAQDSTSSTTDTALALTYFHWGVHAWAIYALSGLAIAWFAFNKKRKMNISSCFSDRDKQRFYLFDFLAIIAVIFGVAGTLANAIALIQTGLQQVLSEQFSGMSIRIILLAIIALCFTASSLLGLDKGIRRLSQFNLYFVILLLGIVIIWGNPFLVAEKMLSSTWAYLKILPSISFSIDSDSQAWSEGWSVIYLVWWIAWAPFVGPFIARISRGRTIRQFILYVVLMPTFVSILWFSAFAGALFEMPILATVIDAVNQDYTQGLFRFFQAMPMGNILSLLAILLLITFVITSADSAIYVTSMLTDDTRHRSKLLWSIILIAIALALLFQNNVDLNKQIAIVGAIPFTLVLIAQILSFLKNMIKAK